ncbi:hypothetical protein BGW36DRAFT_427899 [Talaromyces proteolyticus]|uniref:Uncharacterized protein n=1 Tax=Talaromyces proteolyticus TaxID=1131652 RepID=A0AAD4Q0Z4_9EURO|nr:uncharacterized protein BGW36DRAFT_427899 [Talaromyces proteolyticus]KAH8697967.1 hypothetical protein BGW36DRAFT_427899 [Talaromyces proteolyticus]
MPNPTLLKAAGYGSLLFAIKHAATGKEFQRLRQFQELPNIAYVRSTVGWYQGSAYLVLTGLLNLHWTKNPKSLDDPLNRAMATLLVVIAWASSAWYLRGGLRASGLLTATAGIIQAWAVL